MKHTGFIALIVVAAGAVGAGAVLAQPGGKHGMKMTFEELDTDANGEISQAEIEAMKSARFKAADANGDGMLTLEEMQAHALQKAEAHAARMLDKMDANGDGSLSAEEMSKSHRSGHMFERMDADGSGSISKAEFEQARQHGMKQGHGRDGHGGNAAGHGDQAGAGHETETEQN